MYCEHFGLKEKPFSLAPDPRYLFMSQQHWEAMAHLEYGLDDDWGFVLIAGEIGTGKTTVCRYLLEHLPDNAESAFILNPRLTVDSDSPECSRRLKGPGFNKQQKRFIEMSFILEQLKKSGRKRQIELEMAGEEESGSQFFREIQAQVVKKVAILSILTH